MKKLFDPIKQNSKYHCNFKKAANLSIAVLFIFVIFATCFMSISELTIKFMDIAHSPTSNPNKLEAVIGQIKQFFINPSRGLPFTRELIGFNNQVLINRLQLTLVNDVIIGKDDWLFLNDVGSFDDYRGISKYTDQELSVFKSTVESQRNYLSEKGIPLLLVVAPNKESIYPEFLPENIRKVSDTTRLDQLINYMNLNSKIDILDLRTPLLQEKNQYQLYYKTDSHWTSYGAYFAYSEIMKKLSIYFPGIAANPLDTYIEKNNILRKSGDLSNLLMMEDSYPEKFFTLDKIGDSDSKITTRIHSVVIYHDSFYTELKPFLTQYFDNVIDVATDSTTGVPFNKDIIEKYKPDVVIYIMVERLVPRYFLQSYYFLK